ncbi:nitric oxide synthase [Marinobacter panjinensis]|uniref:NADPH--hemoprotein reductase n=1 Tax=Marinobacter panjinensis TaxID=2576384 RepID=A0A4U6R0S2_9GAMM|nr:PepSY domain-containing protein [Marinobacter panjinensis]MCR8915712.1 PepSY domain-containing protein [Marinobacter panjinensis]TKV66949.1 nitric oxide synthase [Marinobacter panjinensis]
MVRQLHGLPGLVAAVFLITTAITAAVLALAPAMDRAAAVIPPAGEVNVAELAGRVVAHYPGTEQIERGSSGGVIVYYSRDGQPGADLVNPLTGEGIAPYEPSAFFTWIKDLHRAFLLDDTGRAMAGMMAALMVLLCITGILMLARRTGGWAALLRPFAGSGNKRVHSELARFAVLGLLLSALTGSYMSAQRFGLLPETFETGPAFPAEVSGGQPAPVANLSALSEVDLSELRELVFPYPDDPRDVYSLTTSSGSGFVDQATGELLKYQPRSESSVFQQWVVSLHTGEGLWWLGLILGAAALTVPVLSVTGIGIWWRRRSSEHLPDNVTVSQADTIILVGSEGNATWGFARELHASLNKAGFRVHCSEMNALTGHYPQASMLFVLTSTYGDGDAPTSARRFMARLGDFRARETLKYAVLGFGDSQFPNFCQFALDVDAALARKGLTRLHGIELINRCSASQFSQWGDTIGELIGAPLSLTYDPLPPPPVKLELVERADYGLAVQAPTSILRFKAAEQGGRRLKFLPRAPQTLPSFEAGDLLGVMPPHGQAARFYSLASSVTDGVLEICVRKQPGGLCSGYLHQLRPGDHIDGFVRPNPGFRPATGNTPVILIGAGAGIGPLTGFIRKNTGRHPMYLYWGGRSSQSDFLYQPELGRYLEDQRLTGLNTAFSRSDECAYVQDKLRQDQVAVRQMVEKGAQILVCGGRGMAVAVKQVIEDILEPLRTDVETLRAEGRYLEDVY